MSLLPKALTKSLTTSHAKSLTEYYIWLKLTTMQANKTNTTKNKQTNKLMSLTNYHANKQTKQKTQQKQTNKQLRSVAQAKSIQNNKQTSKQNKQNELADP